MILFSDRGTPYSYRTMNGYSGHTYKFAKADGTFKYVQIHLKTDQGIKNFTNDEANKMAAENPDWNTQDLFESIKKGDFPSWTVYVQVLSPEHAEKFKWNIFDLTKVWPQGEVPLRKIGKFTLNKNAENYFAEIEQVAFSPSHLVPGVEPSADPVLQSRLFSYPDTHRHRLGVNYQQIPVNRPICPFNPYQRDGAMQIDGNYGSNPNFPSTYRPLAFGKSKPSQEHEQWQGSATNFQFSVTEDDYAQPAELWKVLGKTANQQENLVSNVAGHLSNANAEIRKKVYEMFGKVNTDLGRKIAEATEKEAAS
jgi:catalase